MSPTYQGLVYGDAVEISVHTMEGGWGPKTESENKTAVKVSGNSFIIRKWKQFCCRCTEQRRWSGGASAS